MSSAELSKDGTESIQPAQWDWLKLTLPVASIALFAELGYAVLNNSTLPVYLKDGLGIDPALIGPIMMPFFLSELMKGPLGALADKIGRKPLMVVGPLVTVFTPLLFTLVRYQPGNTSFPSLFLFGLLRFLDGLGASALWPAIFAHLGDVVRPEKRSTAMSVLNVTYMVGLALGFLIGGIVDDAFGPAIVHQFAHHRPAARYFPSFYLTSVLFAVATSFAFFGIKSNRKFGLATRSDTDDYVPEDQHGSVTWKSIVETVSAVPGILLLAFVTFFGIGCIALQVKIFALDEFGISETEFGLLFLWPALAIGALAIPLGHLADKWGQVVSVRLGFLIGALSLWTMILLCRNPHVRELSLVISGAMLGIGFVIAFPAWLAFLTTLSNESHRGTIIGAASMAQGLGVLLGTLFGGWLYKHWSLNPHSAHVAPFVSCAIFLTISTILTFIVLKRGVQGKALN